VADRLILVDTLAIIYRGHYAMLKKPLRGRDGTVTSGLSLLLTELFSLMEANPDSYIAAVGDAPDDLKLQTRLAEELIPMLGIPFVEKRGYEADDIIAGYARQSNIPVLIVSPDKDLLQLVNGNVSVLRVGRYGAPSTLVSEGDVTGIMGVPAKFVADLLALMGDSSDNIPGARGIGAKGAVKLIQQHGGIADIYANLSEVEPESLRNKLTESRDIVELSLKLTRLDGALPPDLMNRDLKRTEPDPGKAIPILDRLSFSKIADHLGMELPVSTGRNTPGAIFSCRTNIIYSLEGVEFTGENPISLDTETTSLDHLTADLLGFSVTSVPDESWYVPFIFSLHKQELLSTLENLLNKRGFIAQNAKFDARILRKYGVKLPPPSEDPYLADYILRPDAMEHSLKKLVPLWLGKTLRTFDEVSGGSGSLLNVPVQQVAEYCCMDSAATLCLSRKLSSELTQDAGLEKVYREVELPLSAVLTEMEIRGIGLDRDALRQEGDAISKNINELMELASQQAGRSVNLASPAQAGRVLFDTLGLKPVRSTARGALSTGMTVLSALRNEHPFVATLIEFRELSKLLNTYVQKLPEFVSPVTGLLHTSFNQAVTATGRLSSSNPNLQNIPIRTARGREIRKCFIPPVKGHVFVTADYSQIELRLLAHFAGDGVLRTAYTEHADIHSRTAEAIFGDAEPDHRRKAKEINFSIIYGISPYGLAQRLSISRGEASGIISRYYETYPEVRRFYEETVKSAEEHGEVRTILGRRRPFTGIKNARGNERKQMERAAVNSAVQGSAADIIKLAMIRVENRLQMELPQAGLVLQVHDELVLTCPDSDKCRAEEILKQEMQGAFPLMVPLTVETGTGCNWLEAGH
jgi:DNA polymerase-1